MRQEFLTMRLVVLLGAAATAQSPALQVGSHTVADAPSLSLSAPSLRALALRVQLPGTRPGELKALPLLEGRNATGVPMIFNSSHSVYSVLVPSIPSNNSGDDRAIKGVRLYAEHTLSGGAGGKTDGSPEVRVIAHNKPGDGPEGFDEHDQREHLEDPYCGVVEGPCVGHDTQLGGFYMPLNHEQGKKTRFQLVACPADDGEETCEKQGHTYTLWVFFPDWDPSTQPDADLSWGWVAGCVLCEISAFLYACGICLQRYGLSLQVEEEKTKRQSIMGISGSEMPLSVASHIVTAPPGSVAGQMVSVSVNGRMVRVEVPVGVGKCTHDNPHHVLISRAISDRLLVYTGPGDQFSVPLVDGGGGLGDAGASGAAVGGGCKGWCRESLCTKPNLIWVFGMMMWFIGNSLYTFALNYAPLSLLTSLFATVLVFNGALAWFFLQEQVRPSDVTGCFLIFIGITICGIYIDKTVIQFSAHEIVLLAEKPVALVYEVFVLSFIVGITSVVLMYSRNNPGSRGPYPMYMRFAYLPRSIHVSYNHQIDLCCSLHFMTRALTGAGTHA